MSDLRARQTFQTPWTPHSSREWTWDCFYPRRVFSTWWGSVSIMAIPCLSQTFGVRHLPCWKAVLLRLMRNLDQLSLCCSFSTSAEVNFQIFGSNLWTRSSLDQSNPKNWSFVNWLWTILKNELQTPCKTSSKWAKFQTDEFQWRSRMNLNKLDFQLKTFFSQFLFEATPWNCLPIATSVQNCARYEGWRNNAKWISVSHLSEFQWYQNSSRVIESSVKQLRFSLWDLPCCCLQSKTVTYAISAPC